MISINDIFTIGCIGGLSLSFCYNFLIWLHQPAPKNKLLAYFCGYLFTLSMYFVGRIVLEYLFTENAVYSIPLFTWFNEPFQIGLHLLYLHVVAYALELTPQAYPSTWKWMRFATVLSLGYVMAHWIRVIGYNYEDIFEQAYWFRILFGFILLKLLVQNQQWNNLYFRYIIWGILLFVMIAVATGFAHIALESAVRPLDGWVFGSFVQAICFGAAIDYRLRQLDLAHQAELSEQIYEQQLLAQAQVFAQTEKRLADRLQLAQDLHDDIGPMLAHIARLGDKLSKANLAVQQQVVSKMRFTISNVLKDLKELVWLLQLHDAAKSGGSEGNARPTQTLVERMEQVGMEWLTDAGIEFNFNSTQSALTCCEHLRVRAVENIWRIYKEALNNICRHSKSTKSNIELNCDSEFLYLKIMDNGIGISADMRNNGNGLFNMSKRAKQTGGLLTVESVANEGTCLSFQFPCQNITEPLVGSFSNG